MVTDPKHNAKTFFPTMQLRWVAGCRHDHNEFHLRAVKGRFSHLQRGIFSLGHIDSLGLYYSDFKISVSEIFADYCLLKIYKTIKHNDSEGCKSNQRELFVERGIAVDFFAMQAAGLHGSFIQA